MYTQVHLEDGITNEHASGLYCFQMMSLLHKKIDFILGIDKEDSIRWK